MKCKYVKLNDLQFEWKIKPVVKNCWSCPLMAQDTIKLLYCSDNKMKPVGDCPKEADFFPSFCKLKEIEI